MNKLKAWGVQKNIPSQEMGDILQDLRQTHQTDLTQRTGTKTVEVKGRMIDLAQVKRYMRRKGLSQSDVQPWSDTQASQTESPTSSPASVPSSMYAMKTCPPNSAHAGHALQSILEMSNYLGSCPLDLSFGNDTTLPYHFMLEYPESALHKRTLTSTPDDLSALGECGQFKRRRFSHHTPTSSNFACPFYKLDPTYYNPQNPDAELGRRHRSCAGPGWTSIRRLRYFKAVVNLMLLSDKSGNTYFDLTRTTWYGIQHEPRSSKTHVACQRTSSG